jgi:hypothetical protein
MHNIVTSLKKNCSPKIRGIIVTKYYVATYESRTYNSRLRTYVIGATTDSALSCESSEFWWLKARPLAYVPRHFLLQLRRKGRESLGIT